MKAFLSVFFVNAFALGAAGVASADAVNLTDGGSISIGNTMVTCNANSGGGGGLVPNFCECKKDSDRLCFGDYPHLGQSGNYFYYTMVLKSGTTGAEISTLDSFEICTSAHPPEEHCRIAIQSNPACRSGLVPRSIN